MDVNGLTLEQLVQSHGWPPETLLDVLDEEIAAGRVRVVVNGSVVYELTEDGRRQLEPILRAFGQIEGPR